MLDIILCLLRDTKAAWYILKGIRILIWTGRRRIVATLILTTMAIILFLTLLTTLSIKLYLIIVILIVILWVFDRALKSTICFGCKVLRDNFIISIIHLINFHSRQGLLG